MKNFLRSGTVLFCIVSILNIASIKTADAQASSGTITVKGDINKFYVVTFVDGAAPSDLATELEIGRSNIHQDSAWRGIYDCKV
jgi:hypothetical protein